MKRRVLSKARLLLAVCMRRSGVPLLGPWFGLQPGWFGLLCSVRSSVRGASVGLTGICFCVCGAGQ